jgi:hypothetical protein
MDLTLPLTFIAVLGDQQDRLDGEADGTVRPTSKTLGIGLPVRTLS